MCLQQFFDSFITISPIFFFGALAQKEYRSIRGVLFRRKEPTEMSLYAISDLHLSINDGTDKSMEVFGKKWIGYVERLRKNWCAVVTNEDTVVIPGDISWATTLEEAELDFRFLESLPGKKILGKGNHDYWWSTASKHETFLKKHGFQSISFLHNNAMNVGAYTVAGTRGWFQEDDKEHGDIEKLIRREAIRLELSLTSAKAIACDTEILVFLHFPPIWKDQVCRPIIDLLSKNGIQKCYFGHIHSMYSLPSQFEFEGITFSMISADYLDFLPKRL
jgi:predicted phosphohydrolase